MDCPTGSVVSPVAVLEQLGNIKRLRKAFCCRFLVRFAAPIIRTGRRHKEGAFTFETAAVCAIRMTVFVDVSGMTGLGLPCYGERGGMSALLCH